MFCYKEYIHYADCVQDMYLCTKEGKKAKNEGEAYLYVDLGDTGDWWCDPFGNLEKNKTVKNENIPGGLICEIEKDAIKLERGGTRVMDMAEMAEIKELTETDSKMAAFDVYEKIYNEEAEIQKYYEADFDNDGRKDIIVDNLWGSGKQGYREVYFYCQINDEQYKKTFQLNMTGRSGTLMQYKGCSYYMVVTPNDLYDAEFYYDYCDLYYFQDGRPQEKVRLIPRLKDVEAEDTIEKPIFNIEVQRRFVNDFINISEGSR